MGEWISVEDRLPEDEQYVLIYPVKHFLEDEYMPINTAYYSRHGEWCFIWTETKFSVSGITHWMPLPEPSDA